MIKNILFYIICFQLALTAQEMPTVKKDLLGNQPNKTKSYFEYRVGVNVGYNTLLSSQLPKLTNEQSKIQEIIWEGDNPSVVQKDIGSGTGLNYGISLELIPKDWLSDFTFYIAMNYKKMNIVADYSRQVFGNDIGMNYYILDDYQQSYDLTNIALEISTFYNVNTFLTFLGGIEYMYLLSSDIERQYSVDYNESIRVRNKKEVFSNQYDQSLFSLHGGIVLWLDLYGLDLAFYFKYQVIFGNQLSMTNSNFGIMLPLFKL